MSEKDDREATMIPVFLSEPVGQVGHVYLTVSNGKVFIGSTEEYPHMAKTMATLSAIEATRLSAILSKAIRVAYKQRTKIAETRGG